MKTDGSLEWLVSRFSLEMAGERVLNFVNNCHLGEEIALTVEALGSKRPWKILFGPDMLRLTVNGQLTDKFDPFVNLTISKINLEESGGLTITLFGHDTYIQTPFWFDLYTPGGTCLRYTTSGSWWFKEGTLGG